MKQPKQLLKSSYLLLLLLLLMPALKSSAQYGEIPEFMYFKFNTLNAGNTQNTAPPVSRAGVLDATVTGLTIGGTGQFGAGLQGNAGTLASNNVNPGWTGTHTGSWTISFWLNGPTPPTTRYMFGNSTGNGTFRCFIGGAAQGIRLTGGVPSITLDMPNWQAGPRVIHYVYDQATGIVSAYLNGVFQASATPGSSYPLVGANFYVGAQGTSIEGTMDEFRMYNRALTPGEIIDTWDEELPLSSVPNNIGISSLAAPLNFCAGIQPVQVRVNNFGTNQVNNFQVHWQLNGVTQIPYVHATPALDTSGGTGPNSMVVTLGTYAFTNAAVNFKAWTTLPNGQPDTVNVNDTISSTLQAALSGTYTINSANPTAGTNFQTITAFTNALENYGVCGPVVANIVAGSGPYTERVEFSNVQGASATNTIRLNGNGNTVQFNNTTTGNERILLTFNGSKFVRVDSINFISLSAAVGWGALITNGALRDSITNCTFDLSANTTIGSATNCGIVFSASNSTATTVGNSGNHCYIANNHVKGADGTGGMYYGISVVNGNDSNIIHSNIVENHYYYAIYLSAATGTVIEHNKMHKTNKTASFTSGYFLYTTGVTPNTKINGNRIYNTSGPGGNTGALYGYYLLGDGTATQPVLFSNNIIYNINNSGALYAIYLSTAPYTKVYHNTVTIDQVLAGTSANYGIYATGTNTGTEIKNNIVNITAGSGGLKYGFYYSAATSIADAQKNNFYLNSSQGGTQNYGYYTAAYPTQAAFQTAYATLETGSPASDPQFVAASTGDLAPLGSGVINAGVNVLSDVPNDITGQPRSATPTIGAFEFVPSGNNDALAASFLSPSSSYCANTNTPVEVIIGNGGANTINTMQINWSVNGTLMAPYSYSNSLVSPSVPGQSIDTVVIGTVVLPAGNTVIRVWTSAPNGQNDPNHTNDTIVFNGSAALGSNTYTINSGVPTGGLNFNSFNDFATALNAGICGPVVANVVAGSGPYNEIVEFPDVSGSSSTNTIRINGNGETIQFNSTGTNNHRIVSLNGTQYMTINNLKIKTLNATYGWGIHVTGNAARDSIINCEVDLSTITGTSSVNASGIVISGSSTSATTASAVNHLYIGNNKVIAGSTQAGGGYYGITFSGVSSASQNDSISIVDNEVTNFYYYGIRCAYVRGADISRNNIHRSTQTAISTVAYGIYFYYGIGGKAVGNRIHDLAAPGISSTSSLYGMYNYNFNNTAATPILIANNIIYNLGNYSGIQYLLQATGPATKVYHNTVDASALQGTSTSTMYGLYMSTNTGSEAKNNIINITGGNKGTKYGIYVSSATLATDLQKNNVYVNSTQTGTQTPYYFGAAYATLAAFQTAQPTQEIGSTNVDPQFIASATGDLSPLNPVVMTAGNNLLADVPTDITGAARSATPTVGAFELAISGTNNARSFTFLSPSGNYCTGIMPVELMIGNVGTNDISTLQINWRLNGVLQTPVSYTGTLVPIGSASGQSFDTVLLGNANLVAGNNQIIAWTSLPNGLADSQPINDTATTNAVPAIFATSASIDTICANQTSVVSLTPGSGYAEGALEWEYSTNGTTWQTIPNTDTVNYSVTNISVPTQYRARILTGGNNCVSPAVTVNVNYIAPPVVVHDESCEPDALTVSATASSGNTLKWYEDLTTNTVLTTNNTITTPVLYTTKTYYAVSVNAEGCESVRTPVNATIHVLPPVDLGNDLDTCTFAVASIALDPGQQHPGATFLWDDNSTGATRSIMQSGTYHVTVTDTNTCFKSDTIMVSISPRPVVDLSANGTTFCTGDSKVLDAGPDGENGGEYYWSTGAQTRTITVTSGGTYSVFVTTPAGCSSADTITLTESGQAPVTDGINSVAINTNTFNFSAINPQNVTSYEWNFGDGSPVSTLPNPQHTYAANGNYLVSLKTVSSCAERIDSAYINIIGVGIEETAALRKLTIYPNPNYNGILNIDAGSNITIEKATLINVLGQTVATESKFVKGQSVQQINLPEQLSSGIYNLRIETDKGVLIRKIEIRK
ncbi:MAG: T9SS type A sorting domain-containing protein [Sphingobacteriales bacterium]|nr:MAG: T9SS type A sorting domain-containing protein [Sphingobacteriales bacterium]